MKQFSPTLGAVTAGIAASLFCFASLTSPASAAGQTRGYAVSWFQPDFYYGDGDCPDGVNQSIDFKEVFKQEGKTPEQIAELIAHSNVSPDFVSAAIHRGPHGENVCEIPTSVPDPGMKNVQGKFSYGMNLDGTADGSPTAKSCKHDKFEGVAGDKAVDNQIYRVLGCLKGYRGKGRSAFVNAYINERMRTEGMRTYLIEISGMDPAKTEQDVQVGIYVGADPLVPDAGTGAQFDTTQRINKDTRWHNHVHGKIKDGVLTTDVFTLTLLGDPMWIPEFRFRDARLRLEMKPDGSMKGDVGGYLDLDSVYFNSVKSPLNETVSSGNCPAIYYAMKRYADGYPDPKTGECSFISTAFAIEAVPAFLVHPPGENGSKTAAVTGGSAPVLAQTTGN